MARQAPHETLYAISAASGTETVKILDGAYAAIE